MNTVFVGGSRHVSRLPAPVKERLNNIVVGGHQVIVGDAGGADKAVQKFLCDAAYQKVTVFCSGEKYRNNLGGWPSRNVETSKDAKGFQFYAVKDRQMAKEADFGFMIWDGESPGTLLNVLRLLHAGKSAVLFEVSKSSFTTFKTLKDLAGFVANLDVRIVGELKSRATPEEWAALEPTKTEEQLIGEFNLALNQGETASAMTALGELARMRGMSQVAKGAGVSRESLYRSLNSQGNPEFATVLRVMQALGIQFKAQATA